MTSTYVRAAIAAGCLAAGLAVAATAPSFAADKKYTIYLSNSVIGNDWLQQMIRSAEVAVQKGPLAGRVDLHIETVENTTQAQINSLNNIIAAAGRDHRPCRLGLGPRPDARARLRRGTWW